MSRSDGGAGNLSEITETCWEHPPQDRSSLPSEMHDSPPPPPFSHHADSSSKSLTGKHSASLFQEGYSNRNRWIIGLELMAQVSCCQLSIPVLYVTHIQFPHEKTSDSLAASASTVMSATHKSRSGVIRSVKPIYIIPTTNIRKENRLSWM